MSWFQQSLRLLKKWTIDVPMTVLNVATALGIVGGSIVFVKYRRSIRRHKEKLQERLKKGLVYRDKTGDSQKQIKVLELHPAFLEKHKESWQMCSLGDYLSTLRLIPKNGDGETNDLEKLLERELHIVMGALLIRTLGATVGNALLPMWSKAESLMGVFTSRLVNFLLSRILIDANIDDDIWDPTEDRAALPLNISEVISFVNINQKVSGGNNMHQSPLDWMKRGEIAYNPTYDPPPKNEPGASEDAPNSSLIPNPFVIETDFEAAILGLEAQILELDPQYDPQDRSCPKPTPINETILPGLHLGIGDAEFTHTQRERLRNRLFAVLLTKLSYNYEIHKNEKCGAASEEPYFIVTVNEVDCLFPDDFVQALMDTGHSIEVCPRSTITTFGLNACVKEEDGTWTNIPFAFFLRSGYESKSQRPAYFSPLHGGIDLSIKGPLVGYDERTGKSRRCDIQFYMAIDGMCGWHSNHNPNVPWIELVSTTNVYTTEQALKAIRMGGILACTFNQIGTEMDLPFGGYGVLGVCNDTAAIIDAAVRGETNMYPLVSTGRFLLHIAKFLMKYDWCEESKKADTRKLAHAVCTLESDLHCGPKYLQDACKRYAASYPTPYFQIIADSSRVMREISESEKKLRDQIGPQ